MALGLLALIFIVILDIILIVRAFTYNKKNHSIITTIIHLCIFIGISFASAIIIANSWSYFSDELYNTLSNISGYSIMFGGIVLSIIWFIITIIKQKKLKKETKEVKEVKEVEEIMKKEVNENKSNNEITLKLNSKTLLIIGGAIMGFIIILLLIVMIFKGNGGSSATHDRIELNDSNIRDYITVNLQGALTDYSSSSYRGVRFSGGISSSSASYEFENVSFELDLVVSKTDYAYSPSTITSTYTKRVSLDRGGNYNILESNSLKSGKGDYVFNSVSKYDADSVSYSYDIKNVSGSVVIPKKVID